MKLKMREGVVDFSSPAVMGELDIKSFATVDAAVEAAEEMQELGASFIEVGISVEEGHADKDEELKLIIPAVKAMSQELAAYVAVTTIHPEVMEAAVQAGADLIIDPNALRAEGAVDTIAKLKVPVCLVFDMHTIFEEKTDPTGLVSEFLYERIDACLNAGIARSRILIDPTVGRRAPVEYALKMMGRLNTFKSFALPVTISVPRLLPYQDTYCNEHLSVAVALAIFGVENGVSIIRTPKVEEITLAVDTWQACTKSARPFRLTKLIARRFLRKKDKSEI